MEKYVGIIAAEDEEMLAIKNIMNNIVEIKIYNLNIYQGEIKNTKCLLTKCGVGKVNAARTAQILCDKFELNFIINIGSAASLNDSLNIGDIVLGTKLVQHDFDLTPFGREKGYIPDCGQLFESDKSLLKKCENIEIKNQNIYSGIIASGDIFCIEESMKSKINSKFNALCVEMEGASIAQVCSLNKMPFLVIRSISDKPNGNNNIDFNTYLKFASKNCADFILQLL